MTVTVFAYQPTTEDPQGPARPVPNVPLFASFGWTTRQRLNGRVTHPPRGTPSILL